MKELEAGRNDSPKNAGKKVIKPRLMLIKRGGKGKWSKK